MQKVDRAAQFAPFNALNGLDEALAKKEYVKVEKASLSEEMLEFLDYKLKEINLGDMITLVYYDGNNYVRKSGKVSRLNPEARYITIVTDDISFDDIIAIED